MEGTQFYCLKVDNYSTPSYCSNEKLYYGSKDDVRGLLNELQDDGFTELEMTKILREYDSGDHGAVCGLDGMVLEPVTIASMVMTNTGALEWNYASTQSHYKMKCENAMVTMFWILHKGRYLRCAKMNFTNLSYDDGSGEGLQNLVNPCGFPHMIETTGNCCWNRLAFLQKTFVSYDEMKKDIITCAIAPDLDFDVFCEEVFGDAE